MGRNGGCTRRHRGHHCRHPPCKIISTWMPGPPDTTFAAFLGKLTVVRVECSKCGRFGRYPLHRLIAQHGGNGTIIDWLEGSVSDQCHARCPAASAGLQVWKERAKLSAAHRLAPACSACTNSA